VEYAVAMARAAGLACGWTWAERGCDSSATSGGADSYSRYQITRCQTVNAVACGISNIPNIF
jgi:hypothetical protein